MATPEISRKAPAARLDPPVINGSTKIKCRGIKWGQKGANIVNVRREFTLNCKLWRPAETNRMMPDYVRIFNRN
jgi:hypothetical protein